MALDVGTRSDMRFQQQRRAWLAALLAEERTTRPEGAGEPRIRVGMANAAGKTHTWRHTANEKDVAYDLRCILWSQTTLDIEGEGPGGADIWHRAVRDTQLVWDVLNEWRVPYLGSLTGGMGTHTEVFMRPVGLARKAFVEAVVAAANERLGIEAALADGGVLVDPVCVVPNYESRIVREFGAGKKGRRKTLWTTGPGPYRPLPLDRDEAYKQAGLSIPARIEVAHHPPGPHWAEIRSALGGLCPVGPQCLPGSVGDTDLDGTCRSCPAGQ